jgi:N-acylneuraminate-9-phosphatase
MSVGPTFIVINRGQDLVEAVKELGLVTAVITNGHPTVQRAKLERCHVASLFQNVLVGGEEVASGGHEKPHPHIFLKACQLSNCLPSEVRNPPLGFLLYWILEVQT